MIGVIKIVKGKQRFFLHGKEVTKKVYQASMGKPAKRVEADDVSIVSNHGRRVKKGWPMKNHALAVTSKQVKEAQESSVRKGVPTEFTKGGRPIFRDKTHYAKYLKAYGFVNWDSNSG